MNNHIVLICIMTCKQGKRISTGFTSWMRQSHQVCLLTFHSCWERSRFPFGAVDSVFSLSWWSSNCLCSIHTTFLLLASGLRYFSAAHRTLRTKWKKWYMNGLQAVVNVTLFQWFLPETKVESFVLQVSGSRQSLEDSSKQLELCPPDSGKIK